jgi:hypothetical protein
MMQIINSISSFTMDASCSSVSPIDGGNLLIRPNRLSCDDPLECACMFIAYQLGFGIVADSHFFRGGFLFVTLIHLVVALISYYGLWMFCYAMNHYREPRCEMLWRASRFRGRTAISAFIFICSLGWIALFFGYVTDAWTMICAVFFPGAPAFVSDGFTINLIVVALIGPGLVRRDRRITIFASIVKVVLVLLFLVLNIYWIVSANIEGRHEKHFRFAEFSVNSLIFHAVTRYVGTYSNCIALFTLLGKMRTMTFERLTRTLRWSLVISAILNHTIASLQFYVLYDDRNDNNFLCELDPNHWATRAGLIIFFCYLLGTFPVYVDPVRLSALAFIRPMEVFPVFIWAATGMIWLLFAMLMRAVVMRWLEFMRIVSTAATGFLQLGCPALMMIRLMGTAPKVHWAGIVGCIALSVAFIAYSISEIPRVLSF